MNACFVVVRSRGFPLSLRARGNQRTRNRNEVNTPLGIRLHLYHFCFFYAQNCLFNFSSLSQWVHACDALELPTQQREQLDAFIDQLYKDIEKGQGFISGLRFE